MVNVFSNKIHKLANYKTLLLIGTFTHIFSTVAILIVGKSGRFPQLFNEHGAMWKDAIDYFERCSELSKSIGVGDFSFLFTNVEQVHIRIYSICYFLFSPIFGENILCFEPFNLMVFLLTLFVIFKVGEIWFDAKTGFLAAFLISLFPTFLLHSTQPLRDPLFILTFFTILYFLILLIKKSLNLKKFSGYLIGCYFLFILIWLIRDGAYPVYAIEVTLTLFFLLLKFRQTFKSRLKEIFLFVCFVGLVLTIPIVFKSLRPKKLDVPEESMARVKEVQQNYRAKLEDQRFGESLLKMNMVRRGFIRPQLETGSTIDGDLEFLSVGDVVFYSPRAFVVGTFAPFPNTWFEQGKSFGKVGRLLSAAETFLFYLLCICAILTIYACRKSLENWLLVLVAICGTTSLGFVVGNVGTLYRLRYVFWFMLIIVGVNGFFLAVEMISKRFSRNEKELIDLNE